MSETQGRRDVQCAVSKRRTGRVIIAMFAQQRHRAFSPVVDSSVRYGRKVCLVGRSMVNVAKVAMQLGYLNIPRGEADRGGRARSLSGRRDHRRHHRQSGRAHERPVRAWPLPSTASWTSGESDMVIIIAPRPSPATKNPFPGSSISCVAHRRERDLRIAGGGSRFRPRASGGAEADALAGAAEVLHSRSRRISPPAPSRALWRETLGMPQDNVLIPKSAT